MKMIWKNLPGLLGILGVILVIALFVTGCAEAPGQQIGQRVVTGSGKTETRSYDYTDFSRIEAGSTFDITVQQAGNYSVEVTADDNLFDFLDIRKTGDTLRIGLQANGSYVNTTLQAVVAMPDLRDLGLSGASKGRVSNFNLSHPVSFEVLEVSSLSFDSMIVGDASLEASGASRLRGNIRMQNGDLTASAASRIQLEGTAGAVNINGSGASRAELSGLKIRDARVYLSGASEAELNLTGNLDCELTGASRLTYTGTPAMGVVNVKEASSLTQE